MDLKPLTNIDIAALLHSFTFFWNLPILLYKQFKWCFIVIKTVLSYHSYHKSDKKEWGNFDGTDF